MPSGTLSIEWDRRTLDDLARMLEAAAKGGLSAALKGSVKKAALYVVGEIQRRIRDGNYQALAYLTLSLRAAEDYGSTPLLRTGALVRSITMAVTSDVEAQIGAMKMRSRRRSNVNIAKVLHDGATIRVTDAMRKAFVKKLWALGQRENLRNENSRGASVIRIPPRRFIADVFADAAVVARVETIFYDELKARVELLR